MCWKGEPLGQCARLDIDIIEQASFGLIKWVTASGGESKIWILWGVKKRAGNETTPQISSAGGRDLIEGERVNWKCWHLSANSKTQKLYILVHSVGILSMARCMWSLQVPRLIIQKTVVYLHKSVFLFSKKCVWSHTFSRAYCMCASARLVGRNSLIPLELRHY